MNKMDKSEAIKDAGYFVPITQETPRQEKLVPIEKFFEEIGVPVIDPETGEAKTFDFQSLALPPELEQVFRRDIDDCLKALGELSRRVIALENIPPRTYVAPPPVPGAEPVADIPDIALVDEERIELLERDLALMRENLRKIVAKLETDGGDASIPIAKTALNIATASKIIEQRLSSIERRFASLEDAVRDMERSDEKIAATNSRVAELARRIDEVEEAARTPSSIPPAIPGDGEGLPRFLNAKEEFPAPDLSPLLERLERLEGQVGDFPVAGTAFDAEPSDEEDEERPHFSLHDLVRVIQRQMRSLADGQAKLADAVLPKPRTPARSIEEHKLYAIEDIFAAGSARRNEIIGATPDERDRRHRLTELAHNALNGRKTAISGIEEIATAEGERWEIVAKRIRDEYDRATTLMTQILALEVGAQNDIQAVDMDTPEKIHVVRDQIVEAIGNIGRGEDDGN